MSDYAGYRVRRDDGAYMLYEKKATTIKWTWNINKATIFKTWNIAKSMQAIWSEFKTVKEKAGVIK